MLNIDYHIPNYLYDEIYFDNIIYNLHQMPKFLKNTFFFKFELMKLGRTRMKTATKNIAGTISPKPIF